MLTIDELNKLFPKTSKNAGATGYIPMSFVALFECELAALVKKHDLRRMYRGPRRGRGSTWTAKEDAHSMVLYYK